MLRTVLVKDGAISAFLSHLDNLSFVGNSALGLSRCLLKAKVRRYWKVQYAMEAKLLDGTQMRKARDLGDFM